MTYHLEPAPQLPSQLAHDHRTAVRVGRSYSPAQLERLEWCEELEGHDGQRVMQVLRYPENVSREESRRYFDQIGIDCDDADQVWRFVCGLRARREFMQRAR